MDGQISVHVAGVNGMRASLVEANGSMCWHAKIWRTMWSKKASCKSKYSVYYFWTFFFVVVHPMQLVRPLFPDQGSNVGPWQWEHWVLTTDHQEIPLFLDFYTCNKKWKQGWLPHCLHVLMNKWMPFCLVKSQRKQKRIQNISAGHLCPQC